MEVKKRKGRPTDFDYLVDHFKIINNPTQEEGYYMFETFDEEYEEVKRWHTEKGNNYVWTILDCDGGLYASPGWHFVNRFGYLLAEVPWKEGQRDLKY
jgi:hypothetical protein